MLDLLCTFYDINELNHQVRQFNNAKWPIHYICNWEDKAVVKKVSKENNVEVHWLDFNPDQHLGTFGLAAASTQFANSKYVLHFHADMMFDSIHKLEHIFDNFVKSGKPVGSIPRQWCFNDSQEFVNNKSVPFRTEIFFMESELYKNIFDMSIYNDLVNIALENGHPSKHYEPILYAGLQRLNINCETDIHYFPTVKELQNQHNGVVYYNTKFGETGIWRKN